MRRSPFFGLAMMGLAIVAGIAAYLLVFATLVHKPLTLDAMGAYVDYKQRILETMPPPRILVLAGSNGRFSHSCAQISQDTGLACANLSISASIGLKYQIDAYIDGMRAGDVLYLPLEYRDASLDLVDDVGDEGSFLVYAAARKLPGLYSWHGTLRALFSFDLRFAISGLGEMALQRAGIGRRINLSTLNAQGDETGHTAAKAAAFAARNASTPRLVVDPQGYGSNHYWTTLSAQIERLRARGVIIVGGLPTTFDDSIVPASVRGELRRFYAARGGCFVDLPNHSLYPRRDFYDASYHLNEAMQHVHSAALAPQLAAILRAGHCPDMALAPVAPAAVSGG